MKKFFFVPPYLTFAVSDTEYLITFAVMIVIGLVIGTLAARVRLQARIAGYREQRASALYDITVSGVGYRFITGQSTGFNSDGRITD